MIDGGFDGGAVGDIDRRRSCEPAVGDPAPGNTDTHAVLGIDSVHGLGRTLFVEIKAGDMGSLLDQSICGLTPDAAACADDGDNLAGHLLLGGHALEFGLFEKPVLDVERLLLWQGDILIHGFRTAHHLDGAVVELRGDAALALVLAPCNHAQSGNEDDGWVRIAHGGGVLPLAGVVVGGVVLAVLLDPFGEKRAQPLEIVGLGVPIHVEGLDLGTKEMVGAGGAQLRKAGRVLRVHKAEDGVVLLDGADETFLLTDLTAEPGKDGDPKFTTFLGGKALILGATEGLLSLVVLGDVLGGPVDQVEGKLVTLLLGVGPVDEAMLAHDDALGPRMLFADFLKLETEVEAGALPRSPDDVVTVDRLGEFLAVLGGSDGDRGVRMRVIDMGARHEGVERRVDR